jgi:FKBP-type peptidyl-prolyl cis-trans isomerase 2
VNKAKKGDTVKVRYTGKSEDGKLVGSTTGSPPLEFKIGRGMMPPGFEAGIIGMEIGETRTITVVPEDGFGERIKNLVISTDATEVPKKITPEVGDQLLVRDESDRVVTVSRPDKGTVVLDANHPLAGKTLLFRIQLVAIL